MARRIASPRRRNNSAESIIAAMASQQPPKERRFQLPGLELAALEWGEPGGLPVIALHGWLDNAGSFDLLAPLLDGWHLIAFDAAGHGRSDNRSPDSGYNLWQEVGDMLDLVCELGWDRFSLLGHSRGAAVATLFAGTFPDRIEQLMLIEGGLPFLGDAAEAPENLASVLTRTRSLRGRSGRAFATRDQAIAERVDGFSPVSHAAAEVLARRSLREVPEGWQWHADRRLKAGSEIRLTRELLVPFLQRVQAPSICVLAEDSPFGGFDTYQELLGLIDGIEVHRIPGRHHFHLEGAADEIARRLMRFAEAS
jgi:pimeloyl-ACP methyl ester carboxylesterase